MSVAWGKAEANVVLGRLLSGAAAIAVLGGIWWLLIWGAVEGWKHVGR